MIKRIKVFWKEFKASAEASKNDPVFVLPTNYGVLPVRMPMPKVGPPKGSEPEITSKFDGTTRKAHYGDGVQPWDTMMQRGIAFEFALGCIIKYPRRDPTIKGSNPEEDMKKANWYAQRVREIVRKADPAYPEGRRIHKLFSEVVYCDLSRRERVILGFQEDDNA